MRKGVLLNAAAEPATANFEWDGNKPPYWKTESLFRRIHANFPGLWRNCNSYAGETFRGAAVPLGTHCLFRIGGINWKIVPRAILKFHAGIIAESLAAFFDPLQYSGLRRRRGLTHVNFEF
jgi:hypothetical protein